MAVDEDGKTTRRQSVLLPNSKFGRTYIHNLCWGARLLLGVGEGEKQVARHLRVVFPVIIAAS